jgi:hypothetical protein
VILTLVQVLFGTFKGIMSSNFLVMSGIVFVKINNYEHDLFINVIEITRRIYCTVLHKKII